MHGGEGEGVGWCSWEGSLRFAILEKYIHKYKNQACSFLDYFSTICC